MYCGRTKIKIYKLQRADNSALLSPSLVLKFSHYSNVLFISSVCVKCKNHLLTECRENIVNVFVLQTAIQAIKKEKTLTFKK